MSEELESFYFKKTVDGIEQDYRVTMNETHYDVERDGVLIAKLQHDETWFQIDGPLLNVDFIREIGDRIESNFE